MPSDPAFLDLINTEHTHDAQRVTDHLGEAAALARLERRWGLAEPIREGDVAGLRSLRAALREAVEALMGGGSIGAEALAAINLALAGGARRSTFRCDAGEYRLEECWDDAAACAAWSFARYLAEDDPRRLKLCANEHCRWAFRDDSKNRSRRWCSSAACGNVARLRTFRARTR